MHHLKKIILFNTIVFPQKCGLGCGSWTILIYPCSIELNSDAREKSGELYCLRCHDKMGIPICGACRRPIEERVTHALGKAWHVEVGLRTNVDDKLSLGGQTVHFK